MTLNAYLKYVLKTKNMKVKDLAEQTSLDAGYISRILNNKISVQKERNVQKLCNALSLDYKKIYDIDNEFDDLYHQYLHTVYYLEREKRTILYKQLSSISHRLEGKIQYLDYLLAQFIFHQVSNRYDDVLFNHLDNIYSSFSNHHKAIYLVFYLGYIRITEQFEMGKSVLQELDRLNFEDQDLEMMYHYYRFSFSTFERMNIECLKSYEKCRQRCEETNNTNRLVNLNMGYAVYLSDLGYINNALEINFESLYCLKENNIIANMRVILNNIADSYLLLHDYEKAIEYYNESTKYDEDNSTYFYLGLCYYRLNQKDKAREMVKKGLIVRNRMDYFEYLLKWLDCMLKQKYSLKSMEILKTLWDKYEPTFLEYQKSFILMEMMNYYHYHGMYKEAYELSSKMINRTVVSHTILDLE